MNHNKLIEESEKIFNAVIKEGSGGEQSQLRRIDAEDDKNPATNPKLRKLETKLKHKQKGSDRRAKHRGMLVIPKKDREPKDLKQRLQQRQTMRQARPVKTVGEKLPK